MEPPRREVHETRSTRSPMREPRPPLSNSQRLNGGADGSDPELPKYAIGDGDHTRRPCRIVKPDPSLCNTAGVERQRDVSAAKRREASTGYMFAGRARRGHDLDLSSVKGCFARHDLVAAHAGWTLRTLRPLGTCGSNRTLWPLGTCGSSRTLRTCWTLGARCALWACGTGLVPGDQCLACLTHARLGSIEQSDHVLAPDLACGHACRDDAARSGNGGIGDTPQQPRAQPDRHASKQPTHRHGAARPSKHCCTFLERAVIAQLSAADAVCT